MKAFFASLLLGFSLTAGQVTINHLEEGRYLGEGEWSDTSGEYNIYQSYVLINNNQITFDYAWEEDYFTVIMSFPTTGSGNFDVMYQGGVVGQGYCVDQQCAYSAVVGSKSFTEILIFADRTLHRVGYQVAPEKSTIWEASLRRLDLRAPGIPDDIHWNR